MGWHACCDIWSQTRHRRVCAHRWIRIWGRGLWWFVYQPSGHCWQHGTTWCQCRCQRQRGQQSQNTVTSVWENLALLGSRNSFQFPWLCQGWPVVYFNTSCGSRQSSIQTQHSGISYSTKEYIGHTNCRQRSWSSSTHHVWGCWCYQATAQQSQV